MKRITIILIFLLWSGAAFASSNFVKRLLLLDSQPNMIKLTKDADADQAITFTLSLPAGKQMRINWGDGNYSLVTGPVTTTAYAHTYADTASYSIKWTGNYTSLTYLSFVNEPISGDASQFSILTDLTLLFCYNNSLTGNISGWSALTKLTSVNCQGNSGVTGDLTGWSALTSLTYLSVQYNSALTGELDSWATLASLTSLYVRGCMFSYTTTSLPVWDGCTISVQSNSWTQGEVDAFLADLDAASVASTKSLNIAGTNAAPSAAGLLSEASLEGKGWTVTVTGE